MDSDKPIENIKQDVFERLAFARHLASFLCLDKNETSIVVGIEGKWGEGKTSCINIVKEIVLGNSPRPIIVDYRPWLISTLDTVIEGFFIELASAIGTQYASQNARTAAHKVLQFGKMLAPIKLIPGVEPWGSMVESVLSAVGESVKAGAELANLSLQARKKDLQKSLNRLDRPLVVIIDDVDRLPPDHVRIVFQMLKAVCDFDRVSYLIAYDPQPIRNALSYSEVYDGEKYLEKIVQVSYRLPRLPFTHMKDFVHVNMRHLLAQCSIELSGPEAELFEVLFNRTDLVRVLETPRDVTRLCNRLRLSAPNTLNEVSFSDLVAFETLELKFPELSNIIRTEPDRFVARGGIDEEFASGDTVAAFHTAFAKGKEGNDGQVPLDTLLQRVNYSERKGDAVKSILLFLFPQLIGKDYHERGIPESINRVKNRDALLKLLHCGPTSFTYSSEEAQRFCTKPAERQQILAQYSDVNDLYGWITYLSQFIDSSGAIFADPIGLCDLLLKTTNDCNPETSFKSLPRQLGKFLYEVIKAQQDHPIRYEMLNRLVSSTMSLALSEMTLSYFLADYGIWTQGKYLPDKEAAKAVARSLLLDLFSYEELYGAKERWLASVREAAVSQDFLENQKDVLSILYRWGQLNNNDYSEVQAYVLNHSIDDKWLQKYLWLFDIDTNAKDILAFIPNDFFDDFLSWTAALAQRDEHADGISALLQRFLEAKQDEKEEYPKNE